MGASSNIPIELLKLLYVFSFSLGLWANLSTYTNKRCPKDIKVVFLIFIGILLVMPLNGYVSLVFDEPPIFLSAIASSLSWCYGPLLYLLTNCAVRQQKKNRHALLHFIPFGIASYLQLFQLGWLSFYIYEYTLLSLLLIYLGLSAFTLYTSRKQILLLGREYRNSTYYWMLYLIAGVFLIALYDNTLAFLLHFGAQISFYSVAITVGAFSVYISTISIFLLFQPDIFEAQTPDPNNEPSQSEEPTLTSIPARALPKAHEPDALTLKAVPSTHESDTANTPSEIKERALELSVDAAKELSSQLERLMTDKKFYLETDLSLSKLSAALDISNHHLSELLNHHLKTSFYDYLNGFRFNEAITLMNTHPKQHSITDIAYISGFNNRNTFYRVFKERTGLTPGEYRKKAPISSNIEAKGGSHNA